MSMAATGLILAVLAAEVVSAQPTPRTVAAAPPELVGARGAETPFVEHEAEAARTNGALIGPSRTFGDLAAEASGRRAVRLDRDGQGVTFTLDAPADGLTVRYAVPDARPCRDGDTTIGVEIDGRPSARLPLTPCYGWFYGDYPFSNDPDDGLAHHVYDHVRARLTEVAPAGAELTLRFDALTTAAWVIVDLINLELVAPPTSAPPDAISVVDFGADPTGQAPSREAFSIAIDQGRARDRIVWIPPGDYRIDGHLVVDDVDLIGAGLWWSTLRGHGVGVFGKAAREGGSRNVRLKDFAIIGEVMDRDDSAPLNGVGGALNDSEISGLLIQHTKVGLWLDGPMDGLIARDLRILDQAADGVNFHGGVTNSRVENSFIRNTGDDALAMWSHPTPNRGNAFRRNTVVAPVLANGVAIYGGRDTLVEGNVIADTLTRGGGIHLGARFDATPFEGDVVLRDNLILRAGSIDPVWKFGVGALWLYSLDRPIEDARVCVVNTEILDSTDAAIQVIGERIDNVTVANLHLREAGSVVQIRAPGAATFRNVKASGLRGGPVDRHDPAFQIVDGGDNTWLHAMSTEPDTSPRPTERILCGDGQP